MLHSPISKLNAICEVENMALEAGYQCPMGAYGGYGGAYGSVGGFPLTLLLTIIIVAACTALITYFIVKNSSGKGSKQHSKTAHSHKSKRK